jgi:hypothetical protein
MSDTVRSSRNSQAVNHQAIAVSKLHDDQSNAKYFLRLAVVGLQFSIHVGIDTSKAPCIILVNPSEVSLRLNRFKQSLFNASIASPFEYSSSLPPPRPQAEVGFGRGHANGIRQVLLTPAACEAIRKK